MIQETIHLQQHNKLISKLFEDIFGNKTEIYFKIEHFPEEFYEENISSENRDNEIISFSILSKDLLSYDQAVFQYLEEHGRQAPFVIPFRQLPPEFADYVSSDEDIEYHPYFIEFQVNAACLSKYQKLFSLMDGMWHGGYLLPDSSNVAPDLQKLKEAQSIMGVYDDTIPGILMTSASPVRFRRSSLMITDHLLSEEEQTMIENLYQTEDSVREDSDIESLLSELFTDITDFKIESFNVGDGNCIYITATGKSKKKFYFDIGYRYICSLTTEEGEVISHYPYAENHLNTRKPDMVILSHWDLDHILGVVYAGEHIFMIPWIAPDLNDDAHPAKASAKRLAKYLELRGQLNLIPLTTKKFTKKGRQIFKNDKATIGMAKGGGMLTKINNTGIVIRMEGEEGYTLLAGDAEYSTWPSCISTIKVPPKCSYLLVPHHASNMIYKGVPVTDSLQGRAIICASGDNEKHPLFTHLLELTKKGYLYEITGLCSSSIIITTINKARQIKAT